ncbi:hypothetical protein [Parvularcula sp. LCG005]|uniref:hypothetical protein n=1 Tax=Parvularcula sp. LCG005 TaxID=3078805 RepID=UPI0029425281|nr:hypothetical protein [Parvularcula sp. LCG005]WOI52792.1 hypothetical protein RUI03_11605 [Parvularcula sp. LCG005]
MRKFDGAIRVFIAPYLPFLQCNETANCQISLKLDVRRMRRDRVKPIEKAEILTLGLIHRLLLLLRLI